MALIGAPFSREHFTLAADRSMRKGFFDPNKYPKNWRSALYKSEDTDQSQDKMVVFSGLSTFAVKNQGDIVAQDAPQEAWAVNIVQRTRALQLAVTMEATIHDPNNILSKMVKNGRALREMAEYTRSRDVWALFNDFWTSGSAFPGGAGTGEAIFSATHVRPDGGVYNNLLTGNPTLSTPALEALNSFWARQQKNHRGLLLGTTPELIIVGAGDEPLAYRIQSTHKIQGSADNDASSITRWLDKVVSSPFFEDDGRWACRGMLEDTGFEHRVSQEPNIVKDARDSGTLNEIWTATYIEGYKTAHAIGWVGSAP